MSQDAERSSNGRTMPGKELAIPHDFPVSESALRFSIAETPMGGKVDKKARPNIGRAKKSKFALLSCFAFRMNSWITLDMSKDLPPCTGASEADHRESEVQPWSNFWNAIRASA